jgi:hypothetical protein
MRLSCPTSFFSGIAASTPSRTNLSSRFLNIQCLGKIDIHFNPLKRIFQGKDPQVLGLFIETFENPEVLEIIRPSLSDFLSFKFSEKLRVPDHFARHTRMGSMHSPDWDWLQKGKMSNAV